MISYIKKIVKNILTYYYKSNLRMYIISNISKCKFGKNNFIGANVSLHEVEIGNFTYIDNNAKIFKTKFGIYNRIYKNASLSEAEIGDFTYIGQDTKIVRTKMGKFCSIAPNVKCGLGKHPSSIFISTHPIFYSTLKQGIITFADNNYFKEFDNITIGNDVLIGYNAVIMDGITIGDGVIIGAGAVVTENIPPYAIIGGVPARVIKFRFSEEEIKFLVNFKWWNKDICWLKDNYKKFHDIGDFMSFATL